MSEKGIQYDIIEILSHADTSVRKSPGGRVATMKLKKAGILTKIVVVALILYASVTLINLRTQIDDAKVEKESLQEQVEEKTASNAELQYAIDHSDDDDTIAEYAKDKLGLVMPGEQIFYDSDN